MNHHFFFSEDRLNESNSDCVHLQTAPHNYYLHVEQYFPMWNLKLGSTPFLCETEFISTELNSYG